MTHQRARGTAALVLSFSLLVVQLTITGSGRGCPMHASHHTPSETAGDMHDMSHQGENADHETRGLPAPHDRGTLGDCDLPCTPATCGSAVTCGATVAVTTETDLCSGSFSSNRRLSLFVLAPPNRLTAPEPPPPRA
jgi:hypothetical protein